MDGRDECRRAVIDSLIPKQKCDQLISISRACSGLGFHDNCTAASSTILARVNPYFLPILIEVREKVREAAETALGLEFSLFVEFTGLISWRKGAFIGWHTDDNRDYIKQRDAAAVLYLNTAETDFQGGNFKFKTTFSTNHPNTDDSESSIVQIEDVVPLPGRAVLYSTTEMHCVDPPIIQGERFTLAMWFTKNPEYDEDRKILNFLRNELESPRQRSLPLPAAMHALPDGTDLRLCRLACYGVGLVKLEESGRKVLLRCLEDGEWETPKNLQMAVFVPGKEKEKRKYVAFGRVLQEVSVCQAVCGIQWAHCSLFGKESKNNGRHRLECCCRKERVCRRHLSGNSSEELLEDGGYEIRCCDWLDGGIEGIVESKSSSEAEDLVSRLESAVLGYCSEIEPSFKRRFFAAKEAWLAENAVFSVG